MSLDCEKESKELRKCLHGMGRALMSRMDYDVERVMDCIPIGTLPRVRRYVRLCLMVDSINHAASDRRIQAIRETAAAMRGADMDRVIKAVDEKHGEYYQTPYPVWEDVTV